MKINVMTTIEIESTEENITEQDVNNAYEEFKDIIKDAVKFGDLTSFLFVNADTNMLIEDEVDENDWNNRFEYCKNNYIIPNMFLWWVVDRRNAYF